MAEAARQAALLAVHSPTALAIAATFVFAHYIEFDQPCQVVTDQAEPSTDGATVVHVEFAQGGGQAVDCTVELRAA